MKKCARFGKKFDENVKNMKNLMKIITIIKI